MIRLDLLTPLDGLQADAPPDAQTPTLRTEGTLLKKPQILICLA